MGTIANTSIYPTTYTRAGSSINLDTPEVEGVLGIDNGGTGSDTVSGATASLGLEIGIDVQPYNQILDVVGHTTTTGHVSGGELTLNEDPIKFNISAGSGYIIDNYTNPHIPTFTKVEWSAINDVEDLHIINSTTTQIMMDSSCNVVQLSTIPTPEQKRDYIYLGKTVHTNLSSIGSVVSAPRIVYNAGDTMFDLIDALGPINISGNDISHTEDTLSLKRSAGIIFRLGAQYETNRKQPNIINLGAVNPLVFNYEYRNGNGEYVTVMSLTAVDPSNYDNGTGILEPVESNEYTIQRVYQYSSGISYITYGQEKYSTLDGAIASIAVEAPVLDNELTDACLRAYLVLRGDTEDLSDTTSNKIYKVSKLSPSI